MTQIEKYIERLKTLQNLYEEGQPQHNAFGIAIVEANEMLVKNCSIHGVGRSVSKSKYWKDCPKCGLKKTYGQLVTEEGYCWSCNHRGVF